MNLGQKAPQARTIGYNKPMARQIKKIVIATRNPAKIEYYRHLFTGIVDEVLALNEVGIDGKPTETGETAEENAQIKAIYYSTKTDLPVFCEDEALYADFLPVDKQPGVRVRRINGIDEASDDELFSYWEKIIMDVPEARRTGRWHIAYCLGKNGITRLTSMDHEIKFFYPASKIRIQGWPMSSLEGSVAMGKPNSERTEEDKRNILLAEAPEILEKIKELFLNTD